MFAPAPIGHEAITDRPRDDSIAIADDKQSELRTRLIPRSPRHAMRTTRSDRIRDMARIATYTARIATYTQTPVIVNKIFSADHRMRQPQDENS